MFRRTRICPANIPQHVIQRGNNRQACFKGVSDRATYYMYLARFSKAFGVNVHAWVLMDNHSHLLVTPQEKDTLPTFMNALSEGYAQYYNAKYNRTGKLWEASYRTCLVETEPYFLECQRYIELNPVMARLVSHPDNFQWSSYGSHARGMKTRFHQPHKCYLALHHEESVRRLRYQQFVASKPPTNMAEKIRHALMSDWALGDAEFRERMRGMGE